MYCQKCNLENPEMNKFCGQCGQILSAQFAVKVNVSPNRAIPEHLVKKILDSKPNIEGERKVITVLFSDIVDYTVMSEKLDLEIVQQIMNDYFKDLIEIVHRYEGTVDKLLGDGIMVLFGAPVAHEDHVQRACHCALAIQRVTCNYSDRIRKSYGIAFKARIGLNSGEVLVGSIGSDFHMEYSAIGETVNLAFRMEEQAEPGSILVSGYTHNLVKEFFRFKPLGEMHLKGKKQSIQAFELKKPRGEETRFEAAKIKGLTRFIGREKELARLVETLDRASAVKSQIVGICGEPGVGKSRLLLEFRDNLATEEYTFLEGRCLHYGSNMPYRPFMDILRQYFVIREGDPESQNKEKIRSRIQQLDESLMGYLPFLHDMLSLGVDDPRYLKMENQYKRSKLFEAITLIFSRESNRHPLIIEIEDLHWLDKTSEDLLNYLIYDLESSHILFLLSHRPEYNPPWTRKSNYLQIGIGQLSPSDSMVFLDNLLPDGEPAPDLQQLILIKTEGNPLFMEEFVHTLMGNRTIQKRDRQYILAALPEDVKLPDTILGIIAARIDRLPEDLKNTLQVASVIGKDFTFEVLQEVNKASEELEFHLHKLQQLEFLIEESILSHNQYSFKHALIQVVAYNSLLQKKRKALHENIAHAIEKIYPGELEKFSEVLAYHYKLGESADKALLYLVKAGRRNVDRFALQEAQQFYQEAFERCVNQPDKLFLIDLINEWAYVFVYRADFRGLNELLNRFQSLAELVEVERTRAWFFAWLGYTLNCRGRPLESSVILLKALALAENTSDLEVICWVNAALSYTCVEAGLISQGLTYAEKATSMLSSFNYDGHLYVHATGAKVNVYSLRGEGKKALEYGKKLLEFGEKFGNGHALIMGHLCCGAANELVNESAGIEAYCRRALQQSPDPISWVMLWQHLTWALILDWRIQEIEDDLNNVELFCQMTGYEQAGCLVSAYVGLAQIAKGEIEKGFSKVKAATKSLKSLGRLSYYAILELFQGILYSKLAIGEQKTKNSSLLKNDLSFIKDLAFARRKAILHFNRAAATMEETGIKLGLNIVYLELGRLYKSGRKTSLAHEKLQKSIRVSQEMEAKGYLQEAETLLKSMQKN
jgi:class 3 adenylate cyclase